MVEEDRAALEREGAQEHNALEDDEDAGIHGGPPQVPGALQADGRGRNSGLLPVPDAAALRGRGGELAQDNRGLGGCGPRAQDGDRVQAPELVRGGMGGARQGRRYHDGIGRRARSIVLRQERRQRLSQDAREDRVVRPRVLGRGIGGGRGAPEIPRGHPRLRLLQQRSRNAGEREGDVE